MTEQTWEERQAEHERQYLARVVQSAIRAAGGHASDDSARAVADALAGNGYALVEVAQLERERRWAATARDLVLMVSDLDRNEHGRHAGDADVGDPTGVSTGNPLLPVGALLGYSIGGEDRAYVVPPRERAHDPAAWVATCDCPESARFVGPYGDCRVHGVRGVLEQGAAARSRRAYVEAIERINASGHVTLAAPWPPS